jgi:hypothetical protein
MLYQIVYIYNINWSNVRQIIEDTKFNCSEQLVS